MTRVEREAYHKKSAAEMDSLRTRLIEQYALEGNHRFDKCFAIAWNYGHSSGLSEVENYFHELVQLIV